MTQDSLNELPQDFLYGALKVLNIEMGEFMYNLFNEKPTEIMVYARIFMFYQAIKKDGIDEEKHN